MRELHCDTCGGETLFEAPPCVDGHGPDCPELACTDCGSAVLVGPLLVLAEDAPRQKGAPRQNRRRSRRPTGSRGLAA